MIHTETIIHTDTYKIQTVCICMCLSIKYKHQDQDRSRYNNAQFYTVRYEHAGSSSLIHARLCAGGDPGEHSSADSDGFTTQANRREQAGAGQLSLLTEGQGSGEEAG